MAEVIGQVREVNGEFEIVNESGEVIKLQAGQELQLADQIQGRVQVVNGQVQIVDQNGNPIQLASGQTLQTIDSNLESSATITLNNNEQVVVNNQNSLLVDQTVVSEQASNFQETQLDNETLDGLENEISNEENLVAQDSDDSSQEEEEQVLSDDSKARELDRNADIADVIADLREAEFVSREVDTNIEDVSLFVESRLSISGVPLVVEGNTATYTLELTDVPSTNIIVTLSYTGVAKDGVDYTSIKELIIPAGSKTTTFDIKTIDDYMSDNNEPYTITITGVQGGGFDSLIIDESANSVTTTIIDDTGTPNTPNDGEEPNHEQVIIKLIALDSNGEPILDNGNYTFANDVKEGLQSKYMALAFAPNETVFNASTKLDKQIGNIDIEFSNESANGADSQSKNDGSQDYKNTTQTNVKLGSVISADTFDDYIADNGEKFNVSIKDKSYSSSSNTGYENVNIDTTPVKTTIEDDSKANTPNTPNDGEEPNHEQVIIKLIALDSNGEPILDNGNYTFANDVKEGLQSKYMALAFAPNETVFNASTKLDKQIGNIDIEFSNESAIGANSQSKNDGSQDYKNTTQTNVKLGSVISADTFDDYIADNGEKFNVSIKDKSYSSSSNTGYENVNIDTTPVKTTIEDDSKANTPNTPNDGEEPNHEQVIIKLIALDSNGEPILDNGNYTFANDVKEGLQSKYMALAFAPNETVFNASTKLDKQIGNIDIEFSNESAIGANSQSKNDGSQDYKNTTQTNVKLGSVISADTFDDYIADNGEKFNVSIKDKSYSSSSNTGYENVNIDTTPVKTTIEDDSKANTPNNPNDTIEPTLDSVTLKIVALDENGNEVPSNVVKEGNPASYKVVLEDKNGNRIEDAKGSVEVTFSGNTASNNVDFNSNKQTVEINKVFSTDTIDDYLSDNNETFNVKITDKTYTNASKYENVIHNQTPVTTTITDGQDDAIAKEDKDTVYVKIENNVSTKESENLTHKLILVDKDGNEVTIPAGKVITVDLEYSSSNGVIDSDFTTIVKQVKIEASSNKSFTNITLDDFLQEGTENYTVTIKKVTDESKYFENVEIHNNKTATGEITDGLYIGKAEDAYVDEDNFNPSKEGSSLKGVERSEDVSNDGNNKTNLGINASNDNNNYTLSFDGTPTFTSDKADFNSTNSSQLTSNGQVIEYVVNANIITAYAGAQRTQDAKVFEISLNKNKKGGADDDYTFKQYKNIDHPLVDTDDNIVLKFGFKVNDGSKSSTTNYFEVTINDSLPQENLSLITTDEDSTKVIILSEESFKNAEITINNGVQPEQTLSKDGTINIYDKDGNDIIGTLKNNGNGTVSFTPVSDYSGETKGFSYKFEDNDGDKADSSITLNVNPIADAPEVSVDDVSTSEDNSNNDSSKTAVSLGLKFDNIKLSKDQTDKNDINGASSGDHAEKNGYIELKFTNGAAISGAILSLGTDTININSDNQIVKIFITDSTDFHYSGLETSGNGIYTLTKAQYEAIKILHKEDNDTDINIKVSTISYEVDDNNVPLNKNDEKLYEKAEDTMSVKIAAKTDPISLSWNNSNNLGTISSDSKTFTFNQIKEGAEERKIDLKALLTKTSGYESTNGLQNDLDGSEIREYEISGIPEGTIVTLNGQTATAGKDGIAKIVFNAANNKEEDPDFSIQLPQFFGDSISGAKIKLSVYDKGVESGDTDSTDYGNGANGIRTKEVFFNIDVTPVSNKATISVEQSLGDEDAGRTNGNTNAKDGTITNPENGIELDVYITSDDKDGSEKFKVSFDEIPDGVSLYVYDSSTSSYKLVDQNSIDSGNISFSSGSKQNTWKITIDDYQNNKPVKLIPIHNDDSNIILKVQGSSKDGSAAESAISTPKDLFVVVDSVADVPIINELKSINKDGIDSNDGKDIYSEVLEEQSEDSKIDLENVFKTNNPIKSYDNDGSESVGIVLTNLDSKFNVSGDGVKFVGGKGLKRRWVVDKDKIDEIDISYPKNYSGEVDFSLKYTTIEENGSSKTHDALQQNVKVLIKPKAPTSDESINKETNVLEDTLTKVNLDIKNNDGNEKIDFVWIKKSDVDSKDFSLFIGNSQTKSISTLNTENISGTDYYKLNSNELNDLYVLYKSDLGSSSHTGFDFKYQVSDTLDNLSANQDAIIDTSIIDSSYKLNLNPVTDGISIIANAQDNDVIDIVNNKVSITKEGIFKINLDINPLASDNNDKDIDGSETVNKLVIENVPLGIEVQGAVFAISPEGTPFWTLDINPNMILNNSNSYEVTFNVIGKLANGVGNLDTVKITAYNQDGSTAKTKTASTNIDFVDNVGNGGSGSNPGDGVDNSIETNIKVKSYEVIEDQNFTLADILEFKADSNDGQGDNSHNGAIYSIVIKKLDNLKVDTSSLIQLNENGKDFYVLSGTKDEIQNKLSNITLTPESNFNKNNDKGELLKIDVSLISYIPNTNIRNTSDFSYSDNEVTPVTDKIQTTAKAVLDEASGEYNIDISLNTVDAPDFKYVQDINSDNKASTIKFSYTNGLEGTLSWDGGSFNLSSSNTSVDVPLDKLDSLKFKPLNDKAGSVNLSYEVFSKENGASNIEKTVGTVNITTKAIADGFDLGKVTAKGIEYPNDQYIYRTEIKAKDGTKSFDEIVKLDSDETIESMVIEGLPDNFKIYVVNDKGSRTLAQSLGKDDGADTFSWNLNLKNGLPTKVWIDAPSYYSGNFEVNLITYVKDGKEILRTESPISVEIAPIASDIRIDPTKTFGDEYTWIDINLNATMYDTDGSETLSLTLKAKDPSNTLDDTMTFRYKNGDSIDDAVYDEATSTWTINGISHDKIGELQLKYHDFNGQIDVSASTKEEKGSSNSVKVQSEFTLEIASINDIQAGNEDNRILYAPSKKIDAQDGKDTLILDSGINLDFNNISKLKNFEKIDLNKNANHSLDNLEIEDIINMTDSNNSLEILGDSSDSVNLKNSNNATWTKTGTNDGFDIYSKSGDTNLVTLKIDTDINTNII